MWEEAPRSGEGAVLGGSRRKSEKERCWFGAFAREYQKNLAGSNENISILKGR